MTSLSRKIYEQRGMRSPKKSLQRWFYHRIITKPDKGNGVVIINKHDYLPVTKMKQLISDETKFKKLTENPTKSRGQSLICYHRQQKRDHLIDDYTSQKVLPNGFTHGVLYGPPKFTKRVVRFVQLFLPRTPTTTTLPLTL